MISITGNRIDVGTPHSQVMTHRKPHLVMKDDPRQRCALILGDGFTQGYLRHYNLHKDIPCCVNDLIPASRLIPYIPTTGDVFSDDEFFTKEKWPKIFEAVSKGLQGAEFFKERSKQKINPQLEQGLWSLNNNTIDYEIRCYLWHYFRSVQLKLHELKIEVRFSKTYAWHQIFKTILEQYFLQIISFNYDFVAPLAITETDFLYGPYEINKRLFAVFKSPVEMSYDYYMNFYAPGEIPIVYIHGSWINQIRFPFPFVSFPLYDKMFNDNVIIKNQIFSGDLRTSQPIPGFVANPWLESKINCVDNFFSTVMSKLNPNTQYFPMFPDIVPPGYQGHDRYNPFSNATETSRRILNEADFVIMCGLSGREPDTEEVDDLLGSIKKEIDVIHVGLSDDRKNPVAVKLKSMKNVTWRFIDAITELRMVDEYLKDRSSSKN